MGIYICRYIQHAHTHTHIYIYIYIYIYIHVDTHILYIEISIYIVCGSMPAPSSVNHQTGRPMKKEASCGCQVSGITLHSMCMP